MEKSYVANNLIKILIFLPCNLPRGLKKNQTKQMKSLDTHLGLKFLESHREHEEGDSFDIDGDPLNG